MPNAVAIGVSAVLLGCQSMPTTDSSTAQLAAVTKAWAGGMTRHGVDAVVSLYDPDAVLWGTRPPTLRADRADVREYFGILKTVPPVAQDRAWRAAHPRVRRYRHRHGELHVL